MSFMADLPRLLPHLAPYSNDEAFLFNLSLALPNWDTTVQ
jgi:hypothetical protein